MFVVKIVHGYKYYISPSYFIQGQRKSILKNAIQYAIFEGNLHKQIIYEIPVVGQIMYLKIYLSYTNKVLHVVFAFPYAAQ